MVVCCRRKEYEALEAQGEYLRRLKGAIYLQELDDLKIQDYLAESKRGALWETLKFQPALLEQIRSPLFLLMVVVVYQRPPTTYQGQPITYQGQPIRNTAELLDLYIERQLQDLNNQGAYAPGKAPSIEKTHHYLCWLATKLEQQEVTEFLIERLQPSWLDRNHERTRYRIIYGLIGGLFGVQNAWLFSGLLVGLIRGLGYGLSVGLLFGLLFGLLVGLLVGLLFGLDTVTQHGSLRIVLYNSGVAPWNYERFLTHAENHRFIQRVGGRYRFVHDLLRKRFAERYEPHWRN
jgi:hypothetical protein